MRFLVTSEQMKKAEKNCSEKYISYSEMMKNAGLSCAEEIARAARPSDKAVVVCGAGNNGGDGFVIARRLLDMNFSVKVILACGEPKTDISREYFAFLPKNIIVDGSDAQACEAALKECNIAAECVFGTGFHGKLPENIAALMKKMNEIPLKFAVDMPCGANSDTGSVDENVFTADVTLCVAAMKKGMINPRCADVCGKIILLDIGIKEDCFEEYEAVLGENFSENEIFPPRRASSHKGTFGRLLNVAGSLMYSGAAAISTKAALRAGAGLCTLAAPRSVVNNLSGGLWETTYLPLDETEDGAVGENAAEKIAGILPKMTAAAVGCGLTNCENTRKIVEFLIKNAKCPLIIDADGINSLGTNIDLLKQRTSAGLVTVLTPHPAELSRVSGLSVEEITADRVSAARKFSEKTGAVILLKGAFSVIALGKRVFVNTSGCAALAKGGSGDALTGVIAALCAQGVEPFCAAVYGAFVHGRAAERLSEKMPARRVLAGDIIEEI